jgi:Family of unknown function (DUF6152)
MKRRAFAVLVSGLVALGTGVPARAHHSFTAAYDLKQPVEVHGVISQVLLRNPHSWFMLDVRNEAGQVEQWAFEAGTPSGMIRNGYKPSVIKPGAEVTIKGFRARDAERNDSQRLQAERDQAGSCGDHKGFSRQRRLAETGNVERTRHRRRTGFRNVRTSGEPLTALNSACLRRGLQL